MSSTNEEILPEPPTNIDDCYNGRRLWIGNLDIKITEFALLKLLQKYGELEKFDFLYQPNGPDKGKPRGYCFATYKSVQAASKAQRGLNGKTALSKRMIVKPAEVETPSEQQSRPGTASVAASTSGVAQPHRSTQSKISAIEAQLRKLERTKDIDAFLPPNKKTSTQNPASHCLESLVNKTDDQSNKSGGDRNKPHGSRHKSHHGSGSSFNKDKKPYHKHRS